MSSNRGGTRRRNNNPSGRNQYSGSGVTDLVRERPIAAAAVAAGAAAAGLFLWSRRSQISDQLGSLSDQIGEWTDNMSSSMSEKFGSSRDDTGGLATSSETGTTQGASKTGGGNANLGRRSGGGGTTSSNSGRDRAQSTTPAG